MRVLVTEFMDEAAVASLAARRADFTVDYRPALVDDRAALLAQVADAAALIVRNRTQVDAALLAEAPALKVVGRLGVGLDNIDTQACERAGVAVYPATGANALAVAEYVIFSTMLLLRGLLAATPAVAAGAWPRGPLSSGREASGKTLGLVGFGGIGRLVAQRARALGMRVIATDPALPADAAAWQEHGVARVELDALVGESDAISLHVPLVESTRGLFGADRIARMKRGAVLINTSRGGVVDEAALAAALREARIGGAALDVFEREPLPADSVLADVPNLLLTPHVAGVTLESNERVSAMIARLVGDHLDDGAKT
ncbi:MAG: NAD(P)-dependent oxidoreductase [Lautropia sp.]